MAKAVDITGRRYGRLVAVRYSHAVRQPGGSTNPYWVFSCDCGNTKSIAKGSVTTGQQVSCGCFQKEVVSRTRNGLNKEVNKRISSYKSNAAQRKITFELTDEQCLKLMISPCTYCGADGYGIDRVDSKLGYTTQNCTPCCSNCNRAKWEMSVDQYRAWLLRASKYLLTENT